MPLAPTPSNNSVKKVRVMCVLCARVLAVAYALVHPDPSTHPHTQTHSHMHRDKEAAACSAAMLVVAVATVVGIQMVLLPYICFVCHANTLAHIHVHTFIHMHAHVYAYMQMHIHMRHAHMQNLFTREAKLFRPNEIATFMLSVRLR